MERTKIEQRIKNAVNVFFESEAHENTENSLFFPNDSALFTQERTARFNEKADVFVKILKRTFIYFPGVFYLFFGTFQVLFFDFFRSPFTILTMFLIGSFMTIFGIGNVKNPKHLMIPLSIVLTSVAAFSFFSMFGTLIYVFDYGIYFFPIALTVPFLAKSLADKTDEVQN